MASLTGGFAPIAGAGATKDKGAAKKSELTGGLISFGNGGGASTTRNKSDDLDFGDFDVDDLLLDDAGGSGGSKSKSKSKAKSPSSPAKKKKSSSSNKKKKDKKKSSGNALGFLNEDDGDKDDWDKDDDDDVDATKKKVNKSFDLDEMVMPTKKKNARLDEEFARMLGLEDDYADRKASMSGVTNDDDGISAFGDSPLKRDTDALSGVRGGSVPEPSFKAPPPPPQEETGGGGAGGLDASFFQDEPTKSLGDDDGGLSFLSSTSSSERRSGRGGGGRRGAGADDKPGSKSLFADPFDKSDKSGGGGRRANGLDDLFSSSSSSRGAAKAVESDPLQSESIPQPAGKAPATKSTFASLFGSDDRSKTAAEADVGASVEPMPRSLSSAAGSSKPVASRDAKDDLLAELFPAEPPPRGALKIAALPAKDENSQQDDLLAELFPMDANKSTRRRDPELVETPSPPSPPAATPAHETQNPKESPPSPPPVPAKPVDSRKPVVPKAASAGLADINSARDSLLSDLFPESPPRSRRAAMTESSDKASHTKGLSEPSSNPGSSSSAPPPLQPTSSPSPLPAAATAVTVQSSPPKSPASPARPPPTKSESPLPSPGKTKTLTLGTPSKVREIEFEQSKDDLLEEILSSAPSSPQQRAPETAVNGAASPRGSRRSSYSLSFDQDGPIASSSGAKEQSLEAPPVVNAPARRRASRSPDKLETQSPSPPPPTVPTVATATVAPTVFLRDIHAEEELKRQHAAAVAALEVSHAEALARAMSEAQQLQSKLQHERDTAASQATLCAYHTLQVQQLQDELAEARAAHARLAGEFQALQTQHTLQQTQCELFDREKATLVRQLSVAEDQQRALAVQLAEQKLSHQQTQLAFTDFKRETEQTAQLRTEKERAQMDRLYHQLHHSLAQLTMLQEQGTDDALAQRELEASTRLRMISSLETTSRGYVQQTQDECHRLTSLLSSLEATLRAQRQEHLEEKERLRQEQMRLTVLAQHFQAQTSVLNEKSDANAQLLAHQLGASLQDSRTAEARLALRRQQLADDEQKLYSERAQFASHREAWLEQRQRDAADLDAQRAALEREWRALQRERDDLDDVIASHEDAFGALQQQQRTLEAEKDRVAIGAMHVAEMAQQFELLTKQLVDKEHAMEQQRDEMDALRRQWATREHSVVGERRKLDEREARLHAQLKQMETARRQLNDERRQQLQRQRAEHKPGERDSRVMATMNVGGGRAHVTHGGDNNDHSSNNGSSLLRPMSPSTMQWTQYTGTSVSPPRRHEPFGSSAVKKEMLDPSGLSPAFRQLIEENWQAPSRRTDAALHKERMAIHCLGLNAATTTTKSTRGSKNHDHQDLDNQKRHDQTAPSIGNSRRVATDASTRVGVAKTSASRPPPPPPLPSSSRAMSVHL